LNVEGVVTRLFVLGWLDNHLASFSVEGDKVRLELKAENFSSTLFRSAVNGFLGAVRRADDSA